MWSDPMPTAEALILYTGSWLIVAAFVLGGFVALF